jgi:hypothetical protein
MARVTVARKGDLGKGGSCCLKFQKNEEKAFFILVLAKRTAVEHDSISGPWLREVKVVTQNVQQR